MGKFYETLNVEKCIGVYVFKAIKKTSKWKFNINNNLTQQIKYERQYIQIYINEFYFWNYN